MSLDALLTKFEARNIASVTADSTLDVIAKPRLIQSCTDVTAATAHALHAGDDVFAERVALIEIEAGIPGEWAEAFARVCFMQRPAKMTQQGWQCIVDNVGCLLDNKSHLRDMMHYSWSVADIFGCHPTAPETRPDAKGLLLLLNKNEVISIINEKSIGLRTLTGALLHYWKPLNPSLERVMIWDLKP